MRTLIVSSQLSIDGTHGDRQSWVPDFLGEQARGEFTAAYAVQVLEAFSRSRERAEQASTRLPGIAVAIEDQPPGAGEDRPSRRP